MFRELDGNGWRIPSIGCCEQNTDAHPSPNTEDVVSCSAQLRVFSHIPVYPSAEAEAVLLGCLDEPELQGRAAKRLGKYGSIRSAPKFRELLAEVDDVR